MKRRTNGSPSELRVAQLTNQIASWERSILGSLLVKPDLWDDQLTSGDFSTADHRKILGAILECREKEFRAEIGNVVLQLGESEPVPIAYIAGLGDGVVPEDYPRYIREWRKSIGQRQAQRYLERFSEINDADEQRDALQRALAAINGNGSVRDWRTLFHTYDDVINAPPARFAIDGFLQQDGITLIGGLAGHGKTLCMLAMVRALLDGGKLFHHFEVTARADRVIYLIPEAGLGPFSARLRTFHLQEHIQAGRLFCRTLSAQGQLSLTDSRLLEAVKGAGVFLDTAIRFMDGAEDAESSKIFADTLFGLQRAGARTICGAHHSPKSFGKDNFMTLENVLRGSGDIGAMLATCWGLSQVDATSNRIFVQNVKARDFSACEPFIIQGRPAIDASGYFDLTEPPGFAGSLEDHKQGRGRPEIANKDSKVAEARRMKEQGSSYRRIAQQLGVSVGTVSGWLSQ
jgi:hypothetical protein